MRVKDDPESIESPRGCRREFERGARGRVREGESEKGSPRRGVREGESEKGSPRRGVREGESEKGSPRGRVQGGCRISGCFCRLDFSVRVWEFLRGRDRSRGETDHEGPDHEGTDHEGPDRSRGTGRRLEAWQQITTDRSRGTGRRLEAWGVWGELGY